MLLLDLHQLFLYLIIFYLFNTFMLKIRYLRRNSFSFISAHSFIPNLWFSFLLKSFTKLFLNTRKHYIYSSIVEYFFLVFFYEVLNMLNLNFSSFNFWERYNVKDSRDKMRICSFFLIYIVFYWVLCFYMVFFFFLKKVAHQLIFFIGRYIFFWELINFLNYLYFLFFIFIFLICFIK